MTELDNTYRALKSLIGGTADILLADYRMRLLQGEILLQPPSPDECEGDIDLGYAVQGTKPVCPFRLKLRDLPQHILTTGSTGTGKTTLAFNLIDQLTQAGIPWMVFDFKQSFRSFITKYPDVRVYTIGRDTSPFSCNIIKPLPKTNLETHIKKLVPIVDYVFFGGQGTEVLNIRALDSILKGMPNGTLKDVLFYIQNLNVKWGRESLWRQSSQRAWTYLSYGPIQQVLCGSEPLNLPDLLSKNIVFELDPNLPDESLFFLEVLLLLIYEFRSREDANKDTLKHCILIEEAHTVLNRKKEYQSKDGSTVMSRIWRMIREYGESIIALDQEPVQLSTTVIAETGTTISCRLNDSTNAAEMANRFGLGFEERAFLNRLSQGLAIAKSPSVTKPFLLWTPLHPLKGKTVPDSQVKKHMARIQAHFVPERERKEEQSLILGFPRDFKENPYLLQLAQHIHQKPYLLTGPRYRDLEWSVYRGNLSKNLLLKHSYIREIEIEVNRWGAKGKLFQLTKKGRDALFRAGYSQARLPQHGSLVHEYWRRAVVRLLTEKGWECDIEKDNVDVIARRGTDRLHIEVETGKSDVVRNVRKNLQLGCQKLWMLATDSKALKTVQTKLRNAGLDLVDVLEVKQVQELFG